MALFPWQLTGEGGEEVQDTLGDDDSVSWDTILNTLIISIAHTCIIQHKSETALRVLHISKQRIHVSYINTSNSYWELTLHKFDTKKLRWVFNTY